MLEKIISKFSQYIVYDTLGQKDKDTGDSSQRIGLFFALSGLLNVREDYQSRPLLQGWEETVKLHEAAPGLYRRSPDPSYWGYKPDNFSRDQHSVLRIAMAAVGDKKRIKESLKMMAKRFAFHQNTRKGTDDPLNKWKMPDIMAPAEVACAIRGLGIWPLFPVLILLDVFLLVDLLLRKYGFSSMWDIDNMLALNMLYSYKKYKTPVSWLAMKLYKKTDFMARIKNYYSEDNGSNGLEPLYELYKLAYEELT